MSTPRMRWWVHLLAIVLMLAAIGAGLWLRQLRQASLAALEPPIAAPWAVATAVVQPGRVTTGFPALALVKGANEVTVAAQLGGVILEMGPREGQRVAAGEPLARIDAREQEDKLASLEAQRQAAVADAERRQRDAERAEELAKNRSISAAQVDQERTAARAAAEQVRSLEKQIGAERTRLGYARVAAPFTGVVAARLADPGDLAALGKPLFRLIETTSGRLEVRLPASVLEKVRPGALVRVSHDGQSQVLRAARVFPSLDERSLGRLEIEVGELPFGAAPGALLRARVITAAMDDGLLVPPDALMPGAAADEASVLRLGPERPARLHRVPVRVLLRGAEGVAVAGDLAAGDRVVRAHETTLLRLGDGDLAVEQGNPP